jgi:hypothetical protein
VAKRVVTGSDSKEVSRSRRQQELYGRMGMGIPRDIIQVAFSCSKNDFYELLRLANRPEAAVTSAAELEAERTKYEAAKEKAVITKNYTSRQGPVRNP